MNIDNLLDQLKKDSFAISLSSGLNLAINIVEGLDSYKNILGQLSAHPEYSLDILEKIEEIAALPIDENFANENDYFVFAMLLLLRESPNDDNGKFHLAQKCVQQMKNVFWSSKMRNENFLEILYKGDYKSDQQDIKICSIMEFLSEKNFKQIDDILIEINLNRLSTSIMYGIINTVSRYINHLQNYKWFWNQVKNEFVKRKNPDIDELLSPFENGWKDHNYDPSKEDVVKKSLEEIYQEKLNNKIVWAQEIGDEELKNMLSLYQNRLIRDNEKRENYNNINMRYGEKELNKKVAEALRAMANKLEEPGMHFMVHCSLPNLPIFSGKDYVEKYSSSIEVALVAGPLGG